MFRRTLLHPLQIIRARPNGLADEVFNINAKFVEKISRYTVQEIGAAYVNTIEVQFLKDGDYLPVIGDLVTMPVTNFVFAPSPLYDFSFAVKAVRLDALSPYAYFLMIPSMLVSDEIVRTKFMNNVARRTYNVVDIPDMYVIYHNPENPPLPTVRQYFHVECYELNGQRADWITYEHRDNNSVHILTSIPELWSGTITIERR